MRKDDGDSDRWLSSCSSVTSELRRSAFVLAGQDVIEQAADGVDVVRLAQAAHQLVFLTAGPRTRSALEEREGSALSVGLDAHDP